MFARTKEKITSKVMNAILKFRTSNGETKDGLRDGAVVFDEIHQFESNKDVRVHISGLGKKPNPREFYIGTDGYVRDGFLDNMKALAIKVLKGEARSNALFPFICKLDNEEEVNDQDNWEMANPMLSQPQSSYAQSLFDTIMEEFEALEDDPSNREEFMTKRMNLPVTDLERSVAKWEEILATDQPMPNLLNRECIGCVDFACIRDFAACGLVFKFEGKYPFITHSFARKEFVDKYYSYSKKHDSEMAGKRKFAPIRDYNEDVLATLCKFSADCIVRAILLSFTEEDPAVIYMSGGGMHNPLLVKHLKEGLPFARFASTTELDVHPDAKEAALFAILANESVAGNPVDFGGRQQVPSVCMGKICLPG
jgi:phage terminase large subunit-like protein